MCVHTQKYIHTQILTGDIKFSTIPPLGAGLHTYCYLSLLDTIGSDVPINESIVLKHKVNDN